MKKNKKKILASLLLAALTLSVIPTRVSAEVSTSDKNANLAGSLVAENSDDGYEEDGSYSDEDENNNNDDIIIKSVQSKNNTTNQNWLCPVCNYKEKFTANIFVIAKSNQSKPIDYSLYKYDQSLKRCYNKCPNCKKIRELCIFYYENNSMKNGYVCTYCGKFFTN